MSVISINTRSVCNGVAQVSVNPILKSKECACVDNKTCIRIEFESGNSYLITTSETHDTEGCRFRKCFEHGCCEEEINHTLLEAEITYAEYYAMLEFSKFSPEYAARFEEPIATHKELLGL